MSPATPHAIKTVMVRSFFLYIVWVHIYNVAFLLGIKWGSRISWSCIFTGLPLLLNEGEYPNRDVESGVASISSGSDDIDLLFTLKDRESCGCKFPFICACCTMFLFLLLDCNDAVFKVFIWSADSVSIFCFRSSIPLFFSSPFLDSGSNFLCGSFTVTISDFWSLESSLRLTSLSVAFVPDRITAAKIYIAFYCVRFSQFLNELFIYLKRCCLYFSLKGLCMLTIWLISKRSKN